MNKTLAEIAGFRVAAVRAGIKASGNLDLGLIVADKPCVAAATFTTNKVVGPAVEVSRAHVGRGKVQAVFVNAGNANTCTGAKGMQDALVICQQAAEVASCQPDEVLICSTGIIGHHLPMEKVSAGIQCAGAELGATAESGHAFAQAIMTTDTRLKEAYQAVDVGGKVVSVAGTAKGSGMIAPNMATMLAFITTDVAISAALLRRALKQAVSQTFNKVTVDNHMSTSDTAIVMASGYAANAPMKKSSTEYEAFARGLWTVCDDLARQIAVDGEGATKAITVKVTGAASAAEAHKALRAIVDSPLVRTAFYGADPNWGRIISAVGYSGATMDLTRTTCLIAGTEVFRAGAPTDFDAAALSEIMKGADWDVIVDLGLGAHSDFCYTCDLTHEYVTINAEYHT